MQLGVAFGILDLQALLRELALVDTQVLGTGSGNLAI